MVCAMSRAGIGGSLDQVSRYVYSQRDMSRIWQERVCGIYRQASSISTEGQKGVTDEFTDIVKDANDAGCGRRFDRPRAAKRESCPSSRSDKTPEAHRDDIDHHIKVDPRLPPRTSCGSPTWKSTSHFGDSHGRLSVSKKKGERSRHEGVTQPIGTPSEKFHIAMGCLDAGLQCSREEILMLDKGSGGLQYCFRAANR